MSEIQEIDSEAAAIRDPASFLEQLSCSVEQTAQAIAQTVDAVLHGRQYAEALGTTLEALGRELTTLRKRVDDVATSVATTRACQDFAHASRLHPKGPTVVYASTFYLGDNVKYAWLDHRQRASADGIDVWFLPQTVAQEEAIATTGAQVLPALPSRWGPEHIGAALSAAVVVTSDHFLHPNPYAPSLLAGARHVQLWHGVSIKEIGLRNLGHGGNLGPQLARVLATCGPYACFTGTAAAAQAQWRRWFRFERYAAVGYPRNDVLYREPAGDDLLNVDLAAFECARRALAAGRRVLLYAPTFRDARPGTWMHDAGLDLIAREARARGDILIVNVHPVEQPLLPTLLDEFPHVLFVAPGSDIYPLLRYTSALITDYSSLMFDYLHLKRPIVIYRPDDEQYQVRSRALCDTLTAARLPGPVAHDVTRLNRLLQQPNFGVDAAHVETGAELLSSLFDHHDGGAARRLWEYVREEVTHACS